MRAFRTTLFWLHLVCGVTAGVVILVMSATGVLLALKPQIQNWIERDVRYVTPRESPRLNATRLLAAVTASQPDAKPQSLTLDRDPSAAAAVSLGRDSTVYVDPYTGAVLGTGSESTAQFFQWLTSWHRYLGASGESRALGRSVTGASNLMFLVLGATGIYIWWPRQFSWRHLRPIVWFRRSGTGRGRDFNWHNTIGIWCVVPILVMTASGAVISYPWASNLVYRITGSPVPARGEAGRGPAPRREAGATGERQERARTGNGGPSREGVAPHHAASSADLDRLWARAEQRLPTWSVIAMRLPGRSGEPVTFTFTDGNNWNRFARSTLTLNSDGSVARWQRYEDSSAGQKLRGWLRFAHTGELGGLIGQLVAGAACLGGCVLVYTGISLALRRWWNWSRAAQPSATVVAQRSS